MAARQPKPKDVTVTAKGVTVTVREDVFDNIDVFDKLAEIQEGNVFAIGPLMRSVLGGDYQRVKVALANEGGVTTVTAVTEFFGELMTGLSEENEKAKN